MTPKEFVKCFKIEKDKFLALYLDPTSGSPASSRLRALGEKSSDQRLILDTILTDVFYHVLLSLDGCASMGGVQQSYTIQDQDGMIVCDGSGEIEALAYSCFHENNISE